jgi:hypothetical protein
MLYIKPRKLASKRLNVHAAHREHHVEPISEPLYIVSVVVNPMRYYNRYKHYRAFEKHMQESGVILYTVELAIGHRHFEVTDDNNPNHIQLRTDSVLWHKENLINIGIQHFPHDWRFGGYYDADFLNTRPDWVYQTLHELQLYRWVQPFSTYSNLSRHHHPTCPMYSFVKAYKEKLSDQVSDEELTYYAKAGFGAPGGAWCFRREAYDDVGTLLDICILGSADLHMAMGLANIKAYEHGDLETNCPEFINAIKLWQQRAYDTNKGSVGYIENHMIHFYHGAHRRRGYNSRTYLYKKYGYNPYLDIKKDSQGVITWGGSKPQFEEAVRQYFKSRNEDD